MKRSPLVVLILGGAAERWECAPEASPLGVAKTPNLDRLAAAGRVFGVALLDARDDPHGAAPLLSILGFDPQENETSRASYLAALHREKLLAEECFVSASFLALFRDLVADIEPGPLRAAESDVLLRTAGAAMQRAGVRLLSGAGAHHLAIAPRASIDPGAAPPARLLGRELSEFEPQVQQHAFAHRLALEALDGHEINEVRRDLGRNGADALWLWGPGGQATLAHDWDGRVSALGTDAFWRGLAKTAGLHLRVPGARTPAGLLKGLGQALKKDDLCFLYARRGVRDARLRELGLRAHGLTDLDAYLVGPVSDLVANAGGRLLVLPDAARDTREGHALTDPVPALLWGEGIETLTQRRFTEAGAAAAGDPLAPGHGLLAYVRHL